MVFDRHFFTTWRRMQRSLTSVVLFGVLFISSGVSCAAEAATWLLEPPGRTRPAEMHFWVLGDFSDRARSGLQSQGWELHTDSWKTLLTK